jgi:hypothetical protein
MSLGQAVERFATVTHGLPDEALEREWKWRAYNEGVRHAFFRVYEELCELAATLATERAAQGPVMTTAQRILASYHAAFRDLQAVLLRVDDELLDRALSDEKWPLRFVLGHTIFVKRQFFARSWYALQQRRQGTKKAACMPDDEVEAFVGPYDVFERALGDPLAGVLAYYGALHERILHELADIGEDELDAPSLWWEEYEVPLQFRLHRFDSHLRQHTIQVEKTLEALGHSPSEAQRLLRLIYRALAEVEGGIIGAWEIGAVRRAKAAVEIAARADEIAPVVA